MSLVKEIVELHGGRIEISSEAGTGTAVTLWWPLGTRQANPNQSGSPANPLTASACTAN